jgi:hypothetical protein
MLISIPAGYTLTTDGRIVPGGPSNVSVSAGYRLLSDGRIVPEGPIWPQVSYSTTL